MGWECSILMSEQYVLNEVFLNRNTHQSYILISWQKNIESRGSEEPTTVSLIVKPPSFPSSGHWPPVLQAHGSCHWSATAFTRNCPINTHTYTYTLSSPVFGHQVSTVVLSSPRILIPNRFSLLTIDTLFLDLNVYIILPYMLHCHRDHLSV